MQELSAYEQMQLRWYKFRVDEAQDKRFNKDAPEDVKNKYHMAREDLKEFVKGLREKGRKI